jgi:hypothetical protein
MVTGWLTPVLYGRSEARCGKNDAGKRVLSRAVKRKRESVGKYKSLTLGDEKCSLKSIVAAMGLTQEPDSNNA